MSKKTDPSLEGRCEIGKIAAAHGVRGDMLLIPLTDFPERFIGMKKLDISLPGKPVKSWKVRRLEPYEGKNTFFLHLQGVEDRNAAEAMKGASVTVPKDERVELEEDAREVLAAYALLCGVDFKGVRLEEPVENLGRVSEIIQTGSNDVYVVKTPDGKEKPVPAVGDAVVSVDVAGGTMTVNIPEGLWD